MINNDGPPHEADEASQAAAHALQQARQRLRREKARIDLSMKEVETDANQFQESGASKRQLQGMEADLASIDTMLDSTTDAADKLIPLEEQEEAERLSAARDSRFASVSEWIRTTRRRARATLREEGAALTSGRGPKRSHVEKVSLPVFDGKADGFHEFRRVFRELAAHEDYSPPLYLAQLRGRLSADAKAVIAGITKVEEAWEELDRRYGNREQAIMTARHKLLHVRLSGPWFQQVEELQRGKEDAMYVLHFTF